MNLAHSITREILRQNLHKIRTLKSSLNMYIKMSPFSSIMNLHYQQIMRFYEKVLPHHIKTFEQLVVSYGISPPILLCGLHKPMIVGLLSHLPLHEQYSAQVLGVMLRNSGQQLNDSIRKLNEHDLDEPFLRKALIASRNSMQEIAVLFPENKQTKISEVMKMFF